VGGLARLRNLGPASERMLAAAGITEEAQLRALGAAAAFARAADANPHVSLNLLWALEGALTDRDWRDVPPERREALRREADAVPPAEA
jgi:DNA transformation protein and related proteins